MDYAINISKLLYILAFLATFIISVLYGKNRNLLPIQLFIIVNLLITIIVAISLILNKNQSYQNLEGFLTNISSPIELILIYFFLYPRISKFGFRISMLIFSLIYIVICTLFWVIRENAIFSFAPDLFGIESLLITIPCFFYIYEVLKSEFIIDLQSDADFILTCGILFYYCISTPIYFSWFPLYYLVPNVEKILILLHLVFSYLLVISFVKAYLCPIQDQK